VTLRDRFDKLEPRERKLLTILMGVLAAAVFLLLPLGIYSLVAGRRDKNVALRAAIESIQENRSLIAERKARHDALLARYAKPAPALAGFIDETARGNGLAPESQDRPETPHGKRYSERLTVVKMHKVGMLALSKTLEKIEQSGYPVAVTRLSIKPRGGETDSYEVELGVSAYDRKPEKESAKDAHGKPAASASATPSEEGLP
jgi:general secretion pathway protein M